jgi:hypothetical protein
MKRVLIFAFVFLLGVAVALIAINYTRRLHEVQRDLNDAVAYSSRVEELQADARSTDRAKVERALWLQLGEQLAFARKGNQTFPPDIVLVEAAYSYVRLAELAKERSDTPSSVLLLDQAVATCKKSKSVNCQRESLQKLVRVLDGKEKP